LQSPLPGTALAATATDLTALLKDRWLRETEHLAAQDGLYVMSELCERLPVLAELLSQQPAGDTATALETALSAIRRNLPHVERLPEEDTGPALLALIGSALLLPTSHRASLEDLIQQLRRLTIAPSRSYDAELAHRLAERHFPHLPCPLTQGAEYDQADTGKSVFFRPWVQGTFIEQAAQCLLAEANTAAACATALRRSEFAEELHTPSVHGHALADGEAGRISLLTLIGQRTAATAAATQLATTLLQKESDCTPARVTRRPGLLSGMAGTAYELARTAVGNRIPSLLLPARLAEPAAWSAARHPETEKTQR
jgi:hypothetical protein